MISVLVVDDEPELLDLISRFLGRDDMTVDTCGSGPEAIKRISETGYDALIVDYEMPGMDGIELLKKLKSDANETPVIIFTGKGREDVVIEALNNGADFYMQKGKNPRMNFLELRYMIKEAVRRRDERKKLGESERRFRKSLENARLIAFQLSRSGTTTFCNDFFLSTTGWQRDEVIGENWFDLFVPYRERGKMKKAYLKNIRENKVNEHFFASIHTHDGEIRHIFLNNTPLYDSEGEIDGISSIGEDVTERDRVIEEMKQSEERFKIIFEYAPDAVYINDLNGKFLDGNRAAEELIGYKRDEIIGKSFLEAGILSPGDISKAINLLSRHVAGEPTGPEEMCLVRKDGSQVVVEMRNYPVTMMGKPFVLGIAHDITERKRSEETMQKVNEKLNLLHSVTRHDILNTLTALLLYVELLKEDEKDPAMRETIGKVGVLAETIRRQVEFTRMYQDIGVHSPQWQSVAGVFRRAVTAAGIGNLTIHNEITDLEIYADPLLENVFSNLLDNSGRHGDHVNAVWLTSLQDKRNMKIIYEDNGRGIAGKEKEKIFMRGYGQNTGFGLFITKEILSITGMEIKETGSPGKGARFEIRVPEGNYRQSESSNV